MKVIEKISEIIGKYMALIVLAVELSSDDRDVRYGTHHEAEGFCADF